MALNVKDKGLLSGSDMSVSGGAVTSNLWTVDGTNNNDVGSTRTILVYPSVDAIEEFKIHRNSYGAEYGQAGGGIINIVTRGGTNEFHGSAFYFGRRDALNANNYFLEKANQPKNSLNRNDFGWTLGGPIIKDKLHFFASMEWNREKRGIPVTALRADGGPADRRLHANRSSMPTARPAEAPRRRIRSPASRSPGTRSRPIASARAGSTG